jgi:hypothetical protein
VAGVAGCGGGEAERRRGILNRYTAKALDYLLDRVQAAPRRLPDGSVRFAVTAQRGTPIHRKALAMLNPAAGILATTPAGDLEVRGHRRADGEVHLDITVHPQSPLHGEALSLAALPRNGHAFHEHGENDR